MLASSLPASAQDLGGIDASVSAAIVSDYRFRGISLSNGRPAIQGGIELARDGWFAGGWGTTLGRGENSGVEIDLYAGREGKLGQLDYRVTGYLYLYPGVPGARYAEVQGQLARRIGPATVTLDATFAPKQNGLPFENVYVGVGAAVPLPWNGASAFARGGLENGFIRNKLDWELGASYQCGPAVFAASIVGSSVGDRFAPRADGSTGLVFSVSGNW